MVHTDVKMAGYSEFGTGTVPSVVEPEPALLHFFAGTGKKRGSGSIHDIILTGSTFTI